MVDDNVDAAESLALTGWSSDDDLQRAQAELANLEVTGSAGGGMVGPACASCWWWRTMRSTSATEAPSGTAAVAGNSSALSRSISPVSRSLTVPSPLSANEGGLMVFGSK